MIDFLEAAGWAVLMWFGASVASFAVWRFCDWRRDVNSRRREDESGAVEGGIPRAPQSWRGISNRRDE